MKILSWNVNGLRSIIKKNNIIDFKEESGNNIENFIKKNEYDIVCFGETKLCNDEPILDEYKYRYFSHSCNRKGYSGVAVFSKIKPISQIESFPDPEGRIICLNYSKFILINTYVPNSGSQLQRLEYRHEWNKKFMEYITELKKKKNIILCGDLNVANEDIDINNPQVHHKSAGFTDIERKDFKSLISIGLYDIYRLLHNDKQEYTYFNYRTNARIRNVGWRIDYFLTTKALVKKIKSCSIESNIYGSDHTPIELVIEI